MRWLLWLYPADWRERYGDELEALLDEHHLTSSLVLDMLLGAIDAWRHPVGASKRTPGRWRMNHWISRSAGLALIAGTALSLLFFWLREQRHGGMGPGQVQGGTLFLAVMWGLILLGLAGLWLHARRTGHASLMGEISFVIGVVAYLMFVRDSGILPNIGPWPSGDDLGLLGLTLFLVSMVLQGSAATMNRLLPLWSTLPLALAPLLSARLLMLGGGLSPDPLRGPADVLYMSAAWLLLGYALLRLPSDARRRPTST